MDTFYYFIQSLPESMGLLALSLAFARVPLRWGRILLGGAIISVVSYIIRALPVTFGFHLPVMLFLLFLFIVKFTMVKPSRAVLAVFSSFFAIALLEYLVTTSFCTVTGLDPNQAMANEVLWSKVGIFQAALLNIIALIVSYVLKPVRESWKK